MDLFNKYNNQEAEALIVHEDEAFFLDLNSLLPNFAEAGACCECCSLYCYNGCGNCCTCYGTFPCCIQ